MDYVRNVLDWMGRWGRFGGKDIYGFLCDDLG